jgi:hypothetical protein
MGDRDNMVPFPPAGLVICLQYWDGDQPQAMRLARLMADIEPRRRDDVVLAFCPRFDVAPSREQAETFLYCGKKFGVMNATIRRQATGHPTGSNEMWGGIMDVMSEGWRGGRLRYASVFFAEADGCPLKRDWLDLLLAEHGRALVAGKRVTGALMRNCVPHVNGSLVIHLSTWLDRPSLHQTPAEQAWDLFHAAALMQECQPTTLLSNPYGATDWTPGALAAVSHDVAYLLNTKDDSALAWAERTLVAARAGALGTEEPTPVSAPRRVRVNG